ncbi:hypothetical protein NA56DRAFT_698594 [Hyaloscypha hepaticicola]|uniref:Uncharacterized protein n=1 Tax=Hyaloscypha hepaticicola TaxID=2082293 RepID=A0A2J6QJG0_9HELO|nr:hypothetical protein NA56DRAFT_698594 [Hyaloscypha hepaticicola]
MEFSIILPALTCLVARVTARLVPQTCTLSNARRVPQFSTAVSIGFILMSDPCLSPSFQISSIDSADESSAASSHTVPKSFFSWLQNIWNNIRNAIKNISIKITIPWKDPDNSQTVDLIPAADDAKAGVQMIKWKAPIVVSRPPVDGCGVTTAPGKPIKECT